MNRQNKSSNSEPDDPFFQTSTKWTIELDEKGDAIHRLAISILNPELRHPISSLLIGLPSSGIYTDFKTEVNGGVLPLGKGYRPNEKRYSLNLEAIVADSSSASIALSFMHRRATILLGETSIAIWTFDLSLHGPVEMEITLPPLHGIRRAITWMVRMLERRNPYYAIDPVELPPMAIRPSHVDEEKGRILYFLEDGLVSPGFAFQRYSNITVATVAVAIAGLIYAVIRLLVKVL